MSLYNMLFGTNALAPMLMKILGINPELVPRFRDCYLSDGKIIIYTRTGGGNREYYDEPNDDNKDGPWNSTLRGNPNYSKDEDDDYDCTYALFYFNFPDEYKNDLEAIEKADKSYKPSEKWDILFQSLKAERAKE